MDARDIIEKLKMRPHSEGGWFAESWRERPMGSSRRASASCIYFLLEKGRQTRWHKLDVTEVWFFHGGSPIVLHTASSDTSAPQERILGSDLLLGQRPQIVVPPHHWQHTEAREGWGLLSCAVSPGFEFEGFNIADPGWNPG